MKRLLRILAYVVGALVVVLVALVLYLSYGDLNRHKGQIESFVTKRLGRSFAIDGAFSLDLFPALKLEAENVHIGNAPWGSEPQMLRVGRIATEINLRSLLSGPVDIHYLELSDVTVILERNSKGEVNWDIGKPAAKPEKEPGGLTKLPFAFRRATLANLKAIVRMPATPDRVATVESLTIKPGDGGLLALQFIGALDGYKANLTGLAGPLESLLSGRNIRLDLNGGFGNMRFAAKGGFGRLNPLDGTDLRIQMNNPDLGTMLKNLRLPAIASGTLDVTATLKDAGKFTDLNLDAKAGDLSMRATGKLAVLGLRDSDLTVKADAADAARLAQVFDVKGVPDGKLDIAGHFITHSSGFTLDGVHATLAGYEAKLDGKIPARRNRARHLRFSATVPNLAVLQEKLPELPMSVQGQLEFKAAAKQQTGMKKILLSTRDIQLDLTGAVGNSRFTAKGGFAHLEPLEGAAFALTVSNPDAGLVLEKLQLPPVASGALDIKANLKKAGKLTDVDVNATIGELQIQSAGTLAMLGLKGSDLTIQAQIPDAASLAEVFGIKGVPAGKLAVTGRVATSDSAYTFDKVHVSLGGSTANLDGMLPMQRNNAARLNFDLAVASLADIKPTLPPLPLKLKGALSRGSETLELKNFQAIVGESNVQGTVTLVGNKDRLIVADLNSSLLDLTPFMAKKPAPSETQPAAQPAPPANKKPFLFDEQPLPYDKLGTTRAKVHLTAAELRLAEGVLHGVDTSVALDNGRLQSQLKATGGFGGSIDGSIDLTPVGNGSATMKVELTIKDIRTGFSSGSTVRQDEVPPVSVKATLTSTGASPHQLAAAANGTVLFTQGPGKTKSGLINMVGGGIISQLLSKLNPFAEKDPYTQVDCMIALAVITHGKTQVAPVLYQTKKVAITAAGNIDLHTEKLLLNFTTRPREGIGISPGMFTNPFLDLTGTLTSPSIGIGSKGVTSGALAAATGGLSVLAKGAFDRVIGETNQCTEALQKAQHPAPAKH